MAGPSKCVRENSEARRGWKGERRRMEGEEGQGRKEGERSSREGRCMIATSTPFLKSDAGTPITHYSSGLVFHVLRQKSHHRTNWWGGESLPNAKPLPQMRVKSCDPGVSGLGFPSLPSVRHKALNKQLSLRLSFFLCKKGELSEQVRKYSAKDSTLTMTCLANSLASISTQSIKAAIRIARERATLPSVNVSSLLRSAGPTLRAKQNDCLWISGATFKCTLLCKGLGRREWI